MSRLEVITGPMFSGKTEELIRRLHRAQIAGKHVYMFKPAVDTRYGSSEVISHNGRGMKCTQISSAHDIVDHVFKHTRIFNKIIVGIDEAQFLDDFLPFAIHELMLYNVKTIVSGLDKDFTTQGFGMMPRLMVLADKLDKLTAVCNKCGADDASFTQRLVDGKPAAFDGPTILVGGTESYEARCRDCFEPA